MSSDDFTKHLQRLRSKDVSQEERAVLLRNITHDPLRMIAGTCRLLLHGEFGKLSEKQVDAIRKVLEYSELVDEAIGFHLEMQGIAVGQPSRIRNQNSSLDKV